MTKVDVDDTSDPAHDRAGRAEYACWIRALCNWQFYLDASIHPNYADRFHHAKEEEVLLSS